MWILQEFALARENLICCGNKTSNWDFLLLIVNRPWANSLSGNMGSGMENALKFITGGLLAGWELSADDVSRWIQGTSNIVKLDRIRKRAKCR
jgi:hypothetical protein